MLKYTIYFLFGMIIFHYTSCKDTPTPKIQDTTIGSDDLTADDLGDLYRYYHSNPEDLEQRDENTIINYIVDNGLTAQRTRSGVYIVMLKEGAGENIKWGDPIAADYKGYFLDGQEFDSSYKRGQPIKFRVGSMVAGWNEAIPFLKRGGKATLILPSHMGYGKKGFPGYVNPDQIILFDIEIKE